MAFLFAEAGRCRDEIASRHTRMTALTVAAFLMVSRAEAAFYLGARLPIAPIVICAALVALALLADRRGYVRLANFLVVLSVCRLGFVGMQFWSVASFHVGRGFPLVDASLARIDEFVGFKWPMYLQFADTHVWFNAMLHPAYMSASWQPYVIVIALIVAGKDQTAIKLELAMIIGLTLTLLVAVFAPAYGAYHYFGVAPSMHPHIARLETGDGTAAALDWLRLEVPSGSLPSNHGGLAAFPSFHTTLAVLFVWYSRRLGKILSISILLLNIVMLLATPIQGSHYLADMLGGAIVAAVSITLIGLLFTPTIRKRPVPRLGEPSLAPL